MVSFPIEYQCDSIRPMPCLDGIFNFFILSFFFFKFKQAFLEESSIRKRQNLRWWAHEDLMFQIIGSMTIKQDGGPNLSASNSQSSMLMSCDVERSPIQVFFHLDTLKCLRHTQLNWGPVMVQICFIPLVLCSVDRSKNEIMLYDELMMNWDFALMWTFSYHDSILVD